jgi:hypothetical protein
VTRLLIAVPSKGRAQTFMQLTGRYVFDLPHDARVFVEPQDYAGYLGAGVPASALIQIDQDNQGLGYAKCAIAQYAVDCGYAVVFKHDDDIDHWSSGAGSNADNRLRTCDTLTCAVTHILDAFIKYPLLGAVSFNYKVYMHLQTDTPLFSYNQRLQTAYLCRTEALAARADISTFEDFYTALKIWVNGGFTARYNYAGMQLSGHKLIGQNTGGLQSFDRAAMAEREIEIMRRFYPALPVKQVKERPWKHEPDFARLKRELAYIE